MTDRNAEVADLERRFGVGDWTARAEAVASAGELFTECCGDSLFERLFGLVERAVDDEKWEVRKAAARALGRASHPRVAGLLDRLARDANRWVREAARRRLETQSGAPEDPTLDELVSVIQRVKPRRMSRTDLLQLARFSGDLHYEDLASETAHELRTLGVSFEGCLSALEDRLREIGREDPTVGTLSGKLRERSRFLSRLVDDLCAYTALPGRCERVSVRGIATVALDMARARIGASRLPPGLASVVDVPAELAVEGVEDRLARAFANVLANGIESISGQGEVRLEAAPEPEGMVLVRIIDTGCGMDAHQVRDAFRRYATSKRSRGGTGLGLPIVKRIVEREHRGRVRIESALGRGTTVIMELPIRQEERARGKA